MPAQPLAVSSSGLLSPTKQGRKLTLMSFPSAGPSAGCSDTGSCFSVVKQALLSPFWTENTQVQRHKGIYLVDKWKELSLKLGLYHFTAYPSSTFRHLLNPILALPTPVLPRAQTSPPFKCQGASILVSAKASCPSLRSSWWSSFQLLFSIRLSTAQGALARWTMPDLKRYGEKSHL